jgi:cysteine desulfurase
MVDPIYLDHHTPESIFPRHSLNTIYGCFGALVDDHFHLFSDTSEMLFRLYFSLYMDVMRQTGRNHVLTFNLASHEILKSFEPLGIYEKHFTPEMLEASIGPRTALVSIGWADAVTGAIHPLEEIAAICKQKQVLLHVDATYLFGKMPFFFQDLDVDFLSYEGALFIKKKHELNINKQSVDQLITFATQAEEMIKQVDHLCTETARLRYKLEQGILAKIPDASVVAIDKERLPNCTAIDFPGVSSQSLVYALSRKSVYAAKGPGTRVSFVLSPDTNEKEILQAIEIIAQEANKLKSYSEALL